MEQDTQVAPSFDVARRELYVQLTQWTYAHVTRPCSMPPATDPVPYFHGTAVTKENQRIWFKRTPVEQAARMPMLLFGGLSVPAPEESYIPSPGDILAGKVEQVTRGRAREREQKEQNDRFSTWYGPVNFLPALLTLVCNGTELSEAQLAHELRVRRPLNQGADDAWALARIVLFGNVDVFAKQHLRTLATERPMRLSVPPLEFVYKCATGLDDESIWDAFVKLVPDARPPVKEKPAKVAPLVMPMVMPMQPAYSPHIPRSPPHDYEFVPHRPREPHEPPRFIGRQPRPRSYVMTPPVSHATNEYTPRSPGYTPQSPGYTPTTPPAADAYDPMYPSYDANPPPPPNPTPPQTPTVNDILALLRSVDTIQARKQS